MFFPTVSFSHFFTSLKTSLSVYIVFFVYTRVYTFLLITFYIVMTKKSTF